ncbi:LRR receptor-like serine threonine-protein kinase [Seminavis robusta]|uniref:LRR receptor-like serine threonine-protein kinase n=1 Tax=Seminavis robusta TaxID=568900 RepID=A0A9N8F0I6_9STRA|nr:LRR receptor-like serine threonine-protein kinase [Seminavis robusta]|eukprot:Sro3561_g349190.1 LRR receptor-like serine threonine-protein kinase (976) ;mRNA; f:1886-5237
MKDKEKALEEAADSCEAEAARSDGGVENRPSEATQIQAAEMDLLREKQSVFHQISKEEKVQATKEDPMREKQDVSISEGELISKDAGKSKQEASRDGNVENRPTQLQAAEEDLLREKRSVFHRLSNGGTVETTKEDPTREKLDVSLSKVELISKDPGKSKQESFPKNASTVPNSDDVEAIEINSAAPSGGEEAAPPPVWSETPQASSEVCARPGAFHVEGYASEESNDYTSEESSVEADIEQGQPEQHVEARVVSDDDLRAEIAQETEDEVRKRILDEAVAATSVSRVGSNRGKWKVALLAVILLVSIVLILVLALRSSPTEEAASVETAPISSEEENTESLLTKETFLIQLLSLVSSKALLLDNSTHQFRALQWMMTNDTIAEGLIFNNGSLEETMSNETDEKLTSANPVLDSYAPNNFLLAERYVLALLYFATGGEDYWNEQHDFLNTNTSVCDWPPPLEGEKDDAFGVRCNEDRRVTKIHFRFNGWHGTIPSELSSVANLEILDMAGMSLYGTLPSEIGLLSRLERLVLAHNELTSTIPTSLEQLTNLQWIYLFVNMFTGTIPSELPQIELEEFLLDNCLLTGTVPPFREEGAMRRIQIQGNSFSGTIPQLDTLGHLYQLRIRDNMLTGTIHSGFSTLTSLRYFETQNNMLSGELPPEIAGMTNLEELLLSNNRFIGQIPNLEYMERLAWLDLSNNRFTGSFPILPGSISDIDLSFNPITGQVPEWISTYDNFIGGGFIRLSHTNLTGSLDPIFCNRSEPPPAMLEADCTVSPLTGQAELECSCCTTCCDDETEECQMDLESQCEAKAGQFELEWNDPTCSCTRGGTDLACSGRQCESCLNDGSICAYPKRFGFSSPELNGTINDENLEELYRFWHCEMQYVKGRNELVSFQYDSSPEEETCIVSVDGVECNSCNPMVCSSGLETWRIDCTNIEQSSFFYPCDPSTSDGGALLASFSKDFMDSSCGPCWHPH